MDMDLTEAQDLFALFFAIYFALIIDRANERYNPWDTYNAWRGKPHNIKRLMAAWAILFIIPLLHFAVLFNLLASVNAQFDMTPGGIINVVLVGLGSFFDFGYYRIYEAFLHRFPESFFPEEELAQRVASGKVYPNFWAHFVPGALYVIVSTLMILIAVLS